MNGDWNEDIQCDDDGLAVMRVTCSHLELQLGPEDEEVHHEDVLLVLDKQRLVAGLDHLTQHLARKLVKISGDEGKFSLRVGLTLCTVIWFFLV